MLTAKLGHEIYIGGQYWAYTEGQERGVTVKQSL
jgi:hypothetical protein